MHNYKNAYIKRGECVHSLALSRCGSHLLARALPNIVKWQPAAIALLLDRVRVCVEEKLHHLCTGTAHTEWDEHTTSLQIVGAGIEPIWLYRSSGEATNTLYVNPS